MIGRMLFTRRHPVRGAIGETSSGYEQALLLSSIRSKMLTCRAGCSSFPGTGPPARWKLEKRFNPYRRRSAQAAPVGGEAGRQRRSGR